MKMIKNYLVAFLVLLVAQPVIVKAQNFAPGTDIVGFGYDVFGEYANQKSKKRFCLFKYSNHAPQMIGNTQYNVPANVILENISEHNIKTVSGESQREYAKNLSANASLSGETMFFEGSVKSSYNFTSSGSEQKYYYTYMDANTKWRISLDVRDMTALAAMLDPVFRKAVDNDDPVKLFATYGTHYIASAYLGGRADFTSESVITQSTSTTEIGLAVEAKYKVVSGTANLNSQQTNTLRNAKTETKLRVVGGNSEFANNISDPVTYEKWASGIATMPVLCDFDQESLRPIWEFASTEARRTQLEEEFKRMCDKRPLPKEIANSIMFKGKFFYIKSKSENKYWDLANYHFYAERNGGKISVADKDVNKEGWQGADRFIKVLGHATKAEFVFFQPQHSDFVADIAGGVKTAGAQLQLWQKGEENIAQMFKMIPVANEKNTFYIENANSGLYLTAFPNRPISQEARGDNNDNQKWIFEAANPETEMAPPPTERFAIENVKGRRFIDVPGAKWQAKHKNSYLQLWDMDHDPDRYVILQQSPIAEYFVIQPMHSQYVWDVEGASTKDLAKIQLYDNNSSDAQQFKFVFAGEPLTYYIINRRSGKVVDASDAHVGGNGCVIQQYSKRNTDNQKWKLHWTGTMWAMPNAEQRFFIKCAWSNKYWDIPGDGDVNTNKSGAKFAIWDLNSGNDRIYKILPSGDASWINIQVQNGGKFVAIGGNSDRSGEPLQLWGKTNANDEKLAIQPTSPTTFVLRTNKWKAVDVASGDINKNGNALHQWDLHFGQGQQFELIYADGPQKGQAYRFF
jgi:hypothetical protein